MNWNHVEAKWQEVGGFVKEKWGKLTDDDLSYVGGKKDRLLAKLKERYADFKDDVDVEVDSLLARLDSARDKSNRAADELRR